MDGSTPMHICITLIGVSESSKEEEYVVLRGMGESWRGEIEGEYGRISLHTWSLQNEEIF